MRINFWSKRSKTSSEKNQTIGPSKIRKPLIPRTEIMINGRPLKDILSEHSAWSNSGGDVGEKAALAGADLHEVDLHKVVLYRADLRSAIFEDADLSESFLSMANLEKAYLRNANLRGANLSGANLSGANLSGANLMGIKGITEAIGLESADFTNAFFWEQNVKEFLSRINKTIK